MGEVIKKIKYAVNSEPWRKNILYCPLESFILGLITYSITQPTTCTPLGACSTWLSSSLSLSSRPEGLQGRDLHTVHIHIPNAQHGPGRTARAQGMVAGQPQRQIRGNRSREVRAGPRGQAAKCFQEWWAVTNVMERISRLVLENSQGLGNQEATGNLEGIWGKKTDGNWMKRSGRNTHCRARIHVF